MDGFAECKNLLNNKTITDICTCLRNYTDDIEYFSLYYINHCKFGNKPWLIWPILIIILLLCFYFISTTGNDYLAETLGIISEKLKLSQNLAGLTLLALGNTAPDVIVAIVSGEDSDQGLTYSLSSILGGGSMVFGFVLSFVIFLGKEVSISGVTFIRDLTTYLLVVSFVLIIGLTYKNMNIFIALVIFGFYVLYVVVCVFMESKTKEKNEKSEDLSLGINEGDNNSSNSDEEDDDKKEKFKLEIFDEKEAKENNEYEIKKEAGDKENNKVEIKENDKKEIKQDNNEDNIDNFLYNEDNNNNNNENIEKENRKSHINEKTGNIINDEGQRVTGFRAINILKEEEGNKKLNLSEIIDATYYGKVFSQNEKAYKGMYSEMVKKNSNKYNYAIMRYYYLTKSSKWSEKSLFEKIIYVLIDYIFDLIRNLSIPPFENKRYNKTIFICLPITIPLFITLFFQHSMFPLYRETPYCWIVLTYYIIAIGLAVLINFTTYRTNLPKCEWLLLISSFIMSLLWVMVASNILIQMIDDAKLLLPFEINESFLAMTILSVGNSVPDFIVNCSLAKQGYAEMALSGCVGAPIFGMSVGFGLSLILRFLRSEKILEPADFDLANGSTRSIVVLIAITGIILNLLQNMILGYFKKFTIKRPSSYIGFTIFFLYIVGITIASFVYKE
jgi:sodium/potassium/calcium exchanger 6